MWRTNLCSFAHLPVSTPARTSATIAADGVDHQLGYRSGGPAMNCIPPRRATSCK